MMIVLKRVKKHRKLRRLSAVRNITIAKTFGKPAMFICDADKYAPAVIGTDRDNEAWNRPFRQSLYIPIRS